VSCRRKSRVPPESEIINIACHAQQRVEASVPAPPVVSRTPSCTSLQQQLVPDSTRPPIEMVLNSTAQSPTKLLQTLKSQLTGLTGGRHRPAQASDGIVFYRPADTPSSGASSEHLAVPLAAESSGGQTEVGNHVKREHINCSEHDDGYINLIDFGFEDSGSNFASFGDGEKTDLVRPDVDSDPSQQLIIVDDFPENPPSVPCHSNNSVEDSDNNLVVFGDGENTDGVQSGVDFTPRSSNIPEKSDQEPEVGN